MDLSSISKEAFAFETFLLAVDGEGIQTLYC